MLIGRRQASLEQSIGGTEMLPRVLVGAASDASKGTCSLWYFFCRVLSNYPLYSTYRSPLWGRFASAVNPSLPRGNGSWSVENSSAAQVRGSAKAPCCKRVQCPWLHVFLGGPANCDVPSVQSHDERAPSRTQMPQLLGSYGSFPHFP